MELINYWWSKILNNTKKVQVSNSRKVIFYFAPTIPDYDESSGGRRATLLLEMMAKKFNVYVFYGKIPPKKYLEKLKSIGVNPVGFLRNIEAKASNYKVDILFFAWYNSFHQFKKAVKWFPSAKVIIDSVDVHWIREERLLISNSNHTKTHVEANKRKEIEAYKAGDIILAVTEQDKRHILKELPLKQVEIVSNIHRQEVNEYNDSGSNKILFFGGFKHTPNIEAVHYLVKEIFPEVLEKVPNAELIIAGSNAPREIIHLGTLPGVTFKGFIPEEELKILYDSIFISVVPLKAGSGIKGKVCESIAYRTPVVTNQIGNEGIGLVHEKDALICENSEMANYIIKSMNRAFNFDDMTNNAWRKIENLIDSNKVRERLLAILEIY